MTAWLLVVVACAACSAPAAKPTAPPPPPAPADDEEASVAWQQANPTPPVEPTISANPIGMNWEKARKLALETRGAPLKPCDFRRKGLPPAGVECIGKGRRPVLLGALVIGMRLDGDSEDTIVRIDIGSALVDEQAWVFAIVDDQGFAITPWVKAESVGQSTSNFRVPLPTSKILLDKTRVIAKRPAQR